MERYGLYLSLAASDRESRDISQDKNFGIEVLLYNTYIQYHLKFSRTLEVSLLQEGSNCVIKKGVHGVNAQVVY